MSDIYVFADTNERLDTAGLCGALMPVECSVELGAVAPTLEMVHPRDKYGKWQYLSEGNVLSVPIPVRSAPEIQNGTTVMVYEVYTISSGATPKQRTLYAKRDKDTVMCRMDVGMRVNVLDKKGDRWKIRTDKTGTGYIDPAAVEYSETVDMTADDGVLPSWSIRPQFFDIVDVRAGNEDVTVTAKHIFYRLLKNNTSYTNVSAVSLAAAAQGLFNNCEVPHDFEIQTDIGDTKTGVEWLDVNPVKALFDKETGAAVRWGAETIFDNWNVYLLRQAGRDRGVRIEYGKNLIDAEWNVNTENTYTRIKPRGEKADGSPLYLPEKYVDSPRIDQYREPMIYPLKCSDCKVSEDTPENVVFERMRSQARAMLDSGCDLPSFSIRTDVYQPVSAGANASEFDAEMMYPYDLVTVEHPDFGDAFKRKIHGGAWDPILDRWAEIEIGDASDAILTHIASWQLPNDISGTKLMLNSVSGDKLQNASIAYAKISVATIEKLAADAITAIRAHVNELVAGTVTTDQLYADLARIAIAQITTANITEANIDWAAIKTLTAEIATIAKASLKDADIEWADIENLNAAVANVADARIKDARITTAQISDLRAEIAKVITLSAQDGKFDFASIRDLLAKAMILEEGVAGSVYIKNLVATQASFVGATLGNLVLKGEDGKYYSVTVQSDGTIHTQQTTVTDTEISAGQTSDGRQIVATDANIANLNASTIKAESAIIADIYVGALTAGKISASEALIASATVPELYVTSIQAIGDSLDLSANKSIRLLLGSRNANHRSETPPVDANVNDLWVQPSTGYTYQRVAESEELPIFVVETEKGDLFYRYDDGITVYDLRMDASGDLYIDAKAPFAVSVNGSETMYWVRVKDSDIARVELLLTEDSIVATVRGSAAYQQDMERVDAAQGSADKAYGEAAKAQQDALAAMNEIAAKAQEIIELETKITQLASEIELRVRQDDLSTYLKLLIEGVQIGRNDSEYNVLIANTGMFIRQFSDVIASFAKRQLTSPAVRIANPADAGLRCVLRTAADGGMMMVSEEAIW